ncbi:unc-45 like b [Fusarium beomiforme]|uniref:Unc-45 like b n=1 Tax=Fusarium beomiforme TaxID=44412 RepID=A0A9P5AUA0_9HYPO|nr:unc-45 like b [Fusarium beomiforme]
METTRAKKGHSLLMEELDAALKQASKTKGKLVNDHLSSDDVNVEFMRTTFERHNIADKSEVLITIPEPYQPYIVPERNLEPISIVDMRLETHHHCRKVLLRVKSPPECFAEFPVVVEDEAGTAAILASYQRLQKTMATEQHLATGSVAILKEPFFNQPHDGSYTLRIDHPSDLIWPEHDDERIPEQWRNEKVTLVNSSQEYLEEGHKFVEKKHWPAPLRSVNEQKKGVYDWRAMYEQAENNLPLIDCATYSSLVEIRMSPGKGHGLFLTEAVNAGDLFLCEKAFSYCHVEEEIPKALLTISMNLATKQFKIGGSVYLLPQITQKLLHNPEHIATIRELSMVEKIITFNAMGAPLTTKAHFDEFFSGKTGNSESFSPYEAAKFSNAGIWLLASRINHNCIGNCRRSFIGDMQIIRATKNMPAGTELLFSYRAPQPLDSYQLAQEELSAWRFTCSCELGKDNKKTSVTDVKKRNEIYGKYLAPVLSIDKAKRLVKATEKTYRGKPANKVRLDLSELYVALTHQYLTEGLIADTVKMTLKCLETLGFIIVAHVPGEAPLGPRLQHLQAFPELQKEAYKYAKLSYQMLIGESDSMEETFGSFEAYRVYRTQ